MEGVTRVQRWWMEAMFPGRDSRGSPAPSRRVQEGLLLALLALTCILFAGRLDHPLLEPEEGRYAEIPRQMLDEGRFLTPVLHGEDYWQKPPLLYWLVMACYGIFGVHDWAARLVPCLAGVLAVVITTVWGWRLLGFWAGLVSGAMLALSARFLYLAGMLTMDGVLCTCVLAGLAAGHLALVEERQPWRWLIASALACALGILTKGPVAIVLIGVPLAALAWLERRPTRAPLRVAAKRICVYLGIVALIAGPWFGFMAWHAPGAAGMFFWLHNLTRYVAPFDHEKPAWFYLPSLLLGIMPWTLLLVPMLPYFWRQSPRARQRRPAALGAFVLAFVWCVLFFSASGCKRQGYILPAFPLLALILGTFVTHGLPWQRWLHGANAQAQRLARRLTIAACAMGITISIAMALADLFAWHAILLPAILFALIGLLAQVAPIGLANGVCGASCVAVVFGLLCCGQRIWLPAYHERFGLRQQVALAAEYEQEEPMPIVTFPKRWDSISFYTRRRDIASYTPAETTNLIRDLRIHGKSLIFVRRGSLAEVERLLPSGLMLELHGGSASSVLVGVIRPCDKD